MVLNFEWDDKKAKSNLSKHKISFEEESTAFADDLSITIEDPSHSKNGNRLVLIEKSIYFKTLVVVNIVKLDNDVQKIFQDVKSVNNALRTLIDLIPSIQTKTV